MVARSGFLWEEALRAKLSGLSHFCFFAQMGKEKQGIPLNHHNWVNLHLTRDDCTVTVRTPTITEAIVE